MSNDACLSPAALERVAGGAAADADLAHLAECAHCGAEVELLRSFLAAEPSADEAIGVRRVEQRLRAHPAWREGEKRRGWAWRPMWGLGLAGLAAALTLGVWLRGPAEHLAPPAYDNLRSGGVERMEPAGDIAAAPATLRWSPVPGAVRYEVRLLDVEEQTLWQGETPGPELPLPVAARAQMTVRRALSWRVRAVDARGGQLASGAERFRVTGE